MSSISPSSSASRGQASFEPSPPCVPEFGGSSEALSAPLVSKLWEQYYQCYQAYLGVIAGKVESDGYLSDGQSSLSAVSSSSSRTAARRYRRARLRVMRRASDEGSSVCDSREASYGREYGYLRFVRSESRPEVSAILGSQPNIGLFLSLEWSLVDATSLYAMRVRSVEDQGCVEGDLGDASLAAYLGAAAAGREWPVRSVGALLAAGSHSGVVDGFRLSALFAVLGKDDGFCYLDLVLPNYRDKLARLLGPSPELSRLVKCSRSLFLSDGDMLEFSLVVVDSEHMHVVRDDSGMRVMPVLSDVAAACRCDEGSLGYAAVVGSRGEQCGRERVASDVRLGVVSPSITQFSRVETLFRRAMRDFTTSSVVVWLDAVRATVSSSSRRLPVERACHVVPVRREGGREVVQAHVDCDSLSLIRVPVGVGVRYSDIEYGARDKDVFIIFRGHLDLEVFPFDGREVPRELAVIVNRPVVAEVVAGKLSSRSTAARFVREVADSAVVLSMPVNRASVEDRCRVVSVTDPLDSWAAVGIRRYEGSSDGTYSVGEANGLCSLSAPRSACGHNVVLNRCVRLISPDASVTVFCRELMVTVRQSSDAAWVPGERAWSFRYRYVADDYCMDRGGPSGSEHSDALEIY